MSPITQEEAEMAQQLDTFREFKEDHRKIRDTLLDLRAAFAARDVQKARRLVAELNVLAGPHFRFEEETLYGALKPILGDYVEKMLTDHDGAILTARRLAEVVRHERFTDEDVQVGIRGVFSLLPHVSDCDGLAIFMEKLEQPVLERIAENIQETREAGLSLLDWGYGVRQRKPAAAAH